MIKIYNTSKALSKTKYMDIRCTSGHCNRQSEFTLLHFMKCH